MAKTTKEIAIGAVRIGGGNRVAIQSMTNTDTKDVAATVSQIHALTDAGCEIIRCAIYDMECADALSNIKDAIHIPLVADIHFDHRIAVAAIEKGADKVRINPGNIGGKKEILEVVRAALDYGVPIRVGANSGSLPKDISDKHGNTAQALVEGAMRNVEILEEAGFDKIVVSLKSSDARVCRDAYKMIAEMTGYPLHLGVTEAGTYTDASIKSAIGLGALLLDGIGDTIRVSITGDPVREIGVAKKILQFCGERREGAEIISCPTCARCTLDIEKLAEQVADYTRNIPKPIKIAVMGCVVNGPGEAREADAGVAGGGGYGVLFLRGAVIKKVHEKDLFEELKKLIDQL
jgi:(E)-4-hydroxy-3-methylbut-2-enyl-diphosphate synthase